MEPRARVRSRVILSPQHAKRFVAAMADNVDKYESSFGTIVDAAPPDPVH